MPRKADFHAHIKKWLACVFPCRTLHVRPRGCPRMTRGRDGTATPFTWDSFIPYSMPVYPGAFGQTPFGNHLSVFVNDESRRSGDSF